LDQFAFLEKFNVLLLYFSHNFLIKTINNPEEISMKNTKKLSTVRFISLLFIFSLLLTVTVGVMTGCSAGEEKVKASKKKKKKDLFDDEVPEGDSSESSDDNSEEASDKNSETNSEDAGNEAKDSNNKEGDKDKKDEKKKDAQSKDDKKDSHAEEDSMPSAEVVWADLMKGNKRFMSGQHTNVNYVSFRKKLTKGQKPGVIVISCSDSRVPPELVFDKNLGEIFVIRTAGNVADPVALGSIEYAAEHLHTKLLVVLGHESCGAVAAAISGEKMPTANLYAIIAKIRPSFKSSEDCIIGSKGGIECVELNVSKSAEDIISTSPIIKKLLKEDKLTVIKAIYKMESGKVEKID
jgi:carbonic anhydrase